MRHTSIGTWAFNVGPYGENPIPFPTVLEKLAEDPDIETPLPGRIVEYRQLTKLKEAEIIELPDRRSVVIKDRRRLEDIATAA